MKKRKRRNEIEVVNSLISYLAKKTGVITRHELCSQLNLNSKTTDKWLALFQMIKYQCPDFKYEKTGEAPIIIRPFFTGTSEEISSSIHQYLAEHGIEMSEMRKEVVGIIANQLSKETPIDSEESQLKMPPNTLIEFKEELAEAVTKGMKGLIQVKPNEIEAKIPQNLITDLKQELTVAVTKGIKGLVHVESKEIEAKIPLDVVSDLKEELTVAVTKGIKGLVPIDPESLTRPQDTEENEFKQELINAITKGVSGLKPIDPRQLEREKKLDVTAALKQELFEAISKGIDGLVHVDSEAHKTLPKAVLQCDKCGKERSLPQHCNKSMSFEKGVFICLDCGEEIQIPSHCKTLMHITIK